MRIVKVTGATFVYVGGLAGLAALTEAFSDPTGGNVSLVVGMASAAAIWSMVYGRVVGDFLAILVPAVGTTGAFIWVVAALDWTGLDTPAGAILAYLAAALVIAFGVLAAGIALGVASSPRREPCGGHD